MIGRKSNLGEAGRIVVMGMMETFWD